MSEWRMRQDFSLPIPAVSFLFHPYSSCVLSPPSLFQLCPFSSLPIPGVSLLLQRCVLDVKGEAVFPAPQDTTKPLQNSVSMDSLGARTAVRSEFGIKLEWEHEYIGMGLRLEWEHGYIGMGLRLEWEPGYIGMGLRLELENGYIGMGLRLGWEYGYIIHTGTHTGMVSSWDYWTPPLPTYPA